MSPNIGLSVTCNTNCSHWCPRILKIICCCCTVDEKAVEKIHHVAQQRFDEDKTVESSPTPEKEISYEN